MSEQSSFVEVITNRYRAVQMDSFKSVDTLPQEWRICDPIDFGFSAEPKFDIPEGYVYVTPFSNSLSPLERATYHSMLMAEGWTNCELCGHSIKHQYPIRCDSRKLLMNVGCDCFDTFMGAGYVTKTIRAYQDSRLREAIDGWVEGAIQFCSDQKTKIEMKNTENPWVVKCTRCNARVKDTEVNYHLRTKHTWEFSRIPAPLYKFRAKLYKISGTVRTLPSKGLTQRTDVVKLISHRKLVNLVKDAANLGVPLPPKVAQDLVGITVK